tara:strand:+ start:2973 stop:3191 length:219 start_codon:yes stop_codon:yes gene_type:complete
MLYVFYWKPFPAANILVVGDSMGSYMGRTLENICPGRFVIKKISTKKTSHQTKTFFYNLQYRSKRCNWWYHG